MRSGHQASQIDSSRRTIPQYDGKGLTPDLLERMADAARSTSSAIRSHSSWLGGIAATMQWCQIVVFGDQFLSVPAGPTASRRGIPAGSVRVGSIVGLAAHRHHRGGQEAATSTTATTVAVVVLSVPVVVIVPVVRIPGGAATVAIVSVLGARARRPARPEVAVIVLPVLPVLVRILVGRRGCGAAVCKSGLRGDHRPPPAHGCPGAAPGPHTQPRSGTRSR